MKKRLIMLLALVMLFAAFSCPALASEPWDLLNSDLLKTIRLRGRFPAEASVER